MYATTSDFNKNLRKTKNGFGVSKKIESPIVHFKGMERFSLGKHSPGPGQYSPEKISLYNRNYG